MLYSRTQHEQGDEDRCLRISFRVAGIRCAQTQMVKPSETLGMADFGRLFMPHG